MPSINPRPQRHGITIPDFFFLLNKGVIVDGRAGGFILGRGHDEGGIRVIQKATDDTYAICTEFEGGEYLLNAEATTSARKRLDEINAHKEEAKIRLLQPPKVTRNSRLICAVAKPDDRLIWIDARGQFLVNSTATFRFFDELEEINNTGNPFANCDLDRLLNGGD